MVRRVVDLTAERFAGLPDELTEIGSWQSDPLARGRLTHREMFDVKHRWVWTALEQWGTCGQLVEVDGEPVGMVLYAPPALVPGAEQHPTSPVSPDAVLLVEVAVLEEHRGGGLGKLLVQVTARELLRRKAATAIEAFADAGNVGRQGLPPEAFLDAIGFVTQRSHPLTPRMRMDLRGTLSWLPDLEGAWVRLVDAVRPNAKPAAGRPAAGRSAVRDVR